MPRVVLVTARFHPHGVVGAIRPTQFAALLPGIGWDVDVITLTGGLELADTDSGGSEGRNRVRYLNPPDRAERSRSALTRLKMAASFQVRRFTVPDNKAVRWTRMISKVCDLAEQLGPDVVVTTSPPHSIHRAGAAVRARLGVPWVADFRDPLLGDPRYGSRPAMRLRSRAVHAYDAWVHEVADAVVHAIPTQHFWEQNQRPAHAQRFHLITNGVPENLVGSLPTMRREGQHVVIAGQAGAAQVLSLARAVEQLCSEGTNIRMTVAGDHDALAPGLSRILGARVDCPGRVSHDEALRLITQATVLGHLLDRRRARCGLLSSKLFEYAATGVPILAVNPTHDDEMLLATHPAAVTVSHDDDAQIEQGLRRAVALDPAPDSWRLQFVAQHSRRSQAERLAGVMQELLA